MERRKAEIAAKRAKLEELKKAREARTSALSSAAPSRPSSTLGVDPERTVTPSSRAQLDDLVSSLLGGGSDVGGSAVGSPSRLTSSRGEEASGRTSRASEELSTSIGPSGQAGSDGGGLGETLVAAPEV